MSAIVVVGAGLLGASVADELAGQGIGVTVLESRVPASGTSGATFAWVNAQDKSPDAYFALNVEGVHAYPSLAATLGGDWYHPGGDIAIGRGPAAVRLAERIERHRSAGYAVRELDRAGVNELEPAIDLPVDGDLVAAHFPDEAWIDAPALVERRLARAIERGAQVLPATPVVGFELGDGRIAGVRTQTDVLAADAVLIAAGPATESLAALVDVTIPMAPSPGLLATSQPVHAGPAHVIHAGDIALRPDGDGRILMSSREVDAMLDPSTRSLDTDAAPSRELVARAGRLVPVLRDIGLDRVRIGVRSVAEDGMPVAGFAPQLENLYLLVAHSGATLAPVLGRLVASELAGGREERLEAYRPARFA